MCPLFNKDFILVPVDMAEWPFYLVGKHDLEIAMMVRDMERFKLTSVEVLFLLMHWSFFFKLITKKTQFKNSRVKLHLEAKFMTKFLQHDIFLLLHNAEPRNICLGI